MRSTGALVLGAFVAACGGSATAPAPVQTSLKHVLVVTHTAEFRHSSIPIAETTMQALGSSSQLFDVRFCRTEADVKSMLTASGLSGQDAVFFVNTTGDLGIPDMRAFLDWIAAGHGFLGAHSAADTYHSSIDYLSMLGGEFAAHGAIAAADVRVDDPSDVSVAHLAPRFTITDELYRFSRNNRGSVHALLSLDRVPDDGVGIAGTATDLLMAWRRDYGDGRVFYTAFGHREEVWQDPRFRQHLLGALRWVLRL